MLKPCVLGLIGGYQAISRFFPPRCRFFPSCSHYMATAVRHHGVFRGIAQGLWRLVRCHPLHPGGYDPVP